LGTKKLSEKTEGGNMPSEFQLEHFQSKNFPTGKDSESVSE